MKSKMTIFIVTLFLSVCTFSSNAQTTTPKGKAQLIEFTNETAKFIVPEGKTWAIYNAFTTVPEGDNIYSIWVKSINGIIITDISKKIFGKILYSSYTLVDIILPLILPENTTIELVVLKKDDATGIRSLYDQIAFLNYIESEN
jgi:hypothetical protein